MSIKSAECGNYSKPLKLPEYDNDKTDCSEPSIFHDNSNHDEHDGRMNESLLNGAVGVYIMYK